MPDRRRGPGTGLSSLAAAAELALGMACPVAGLRPLDEKLSERASHQSMSEPGPPRLASGLLFDLVSPMLRSLVASGRGHGGVILPLRPGGAAICWNGSGAPVSTVPRGDRARPGDPTWPKTAPSPASPGETEQRSGRAGAPGAARRRRGRPPPPRAPRAPQTVHERPARRGRLDTPSTRATSPELTRGSHRDRVAGVRRRRPQPPQGDRGRPRASASGSGGEDEQPLPRSRIPAAGSDTGLDALERAERLGPRDPTGASALPLLPRARPSLSSSPPPRSSSTSDLTGRSRDQFLTLPPLIVPDP